MPYKNKTNKEYQREYYFKNRDGNAEKHRKYYEMNKEKHKGFIVCQVCHVYCSKSNKTRHLKQGVDFFVTECGQYRIALKINEQLKNGNLKIFTDIGNKSLCSFILKISGIWETQYNYGLTYKFIKGA
jgi:hypothetical protein